LRTDDQDTVQVTEDALVDLEDGRAHPPDDFEDETAVEDRPREAVLKLVK
jgi:hypothetical protein